MSACRHSVRASRDPGWNYGLWRSAFFPLEEELGACYGVYNQRLVPLNFGGDRTDGYWALRRTAVLCDVSGERTIEIAGPDAPCLLERLIARDVDRLKPGRAAYGLLCYPDGGLLCDGILVRLSDERFWYIHANAEVYPWFVAHAIGLDVKISDPDISVLQIQGPKSLDVLRSACTGEPVGKLAFFGVTTADLGGQVAVVTRTGWTGELGCEIYVGRDADGPALWRHLLKAGEAYGLLPCGLDVLDMRRIEAGILNCGSDFDASMTPFEAGLGLFVNRDGADFIGKDALLARRGESLMCGLRCPDAEPVIGGTVSPHGSRVGRITAAAYSPYLDSGVALVRLDTHLDAVDRDVMVDTREGDERAARLTPLPFYDPQARIPRGLDTEIS